MRDYIQINKTAYEMSAKDYYDRLNKYSTGYYTVCQKICEFILTPDGTCTTKDNKIVLEIGCGPGGILKILNERYHCKTYGIDISENMLSYAKYNSPETVFINKDILQIDDINKELQLVCDIKFDVIIMAAFIHVFPVEDARIIMDKLRTWLKPNGIIYIDTTIEDRFVDGELRVKKAIGEKKYYYLRTKWTKESLIRFVTDCGYEVMRIIVREAQETKKSWLRLVLKEKE